VGRGLTSPIFHIDEGPFQSNIEISLPAALAAGTAARDEARLNKQPYGAIFTTTAGKKDDRDGRYCFKLVSEAAEWTELFFDCKNEEELEQMVRRNSRSSKQNPDGVYSVNITMNHRQLGKDDAWLRRAIEGAKVYGEDADRDFGNIWTSGNATHPLPLKTLEVIRASVREVNHTTDSRIGGFITRWYIPQEGKDRYLAENKFVMSMDTSDASGGDDISLLLTNVKTGETVATGTYNETNLIVLAEWICKEWIEKYENILVCIERKSSGVAILDFLLLMLPPKRIDPFKRLFNRIVNDREEDPERYKEILIPVGQRPQDIYVRYKKAFGFATAGTGVTSRTELYSTTLQNAAKRVGTKVADITTINQIAGLVTRNGRVDHEVGQHDDMVIAWLLNFWLLSQAKNLSHYGISPGEILANAVERGSMTVEETYDMQQQSLIRQEMEQIYAQLKNTKDEYAAQRLEMKLSHLDKQLILQEHEKFSVDDLIRSIREERRKVKVNNSYSQGSNTSSFVDRYYGYAGANHFQPYKDPMKVF